MSRVRLSIGIAGAAALVCAVVAYAQPPSGVVHPPNQAGKPPLQLGAELYAANCASCHGIKGGGASVSNPIHGSGDIEGAGPELTGTGAQAADFYLRTGRMPLSHPGEVPERSRPSFNEREIQALTQYVASLGGGPAIPHPQPNSGDVSRGMELFTDHCAGCHQVVGEGGYVTDTRVPVLSHATPTQIAEAVRIGPYLMPTFPRKSLNDRQLNSIIAYIQASKHPTDPGGLGIGHIGPVPEGIAAWLLAGIVLLGVCILIGERART